MPTSLSQASPNDDLLAYPQQPDEQQPSRGKGTVLLVVVVAQGCIHRLFALTRAAARDLFISASLLFFIFFILSLAKR
jgi:hypothetical protein